MDARRKLNKGRGIEFMIPIKPKSYIHRRTSKPSGGALESFNDYAEACSVFLPPLGIDFPVNIKAHFYLPYVNGSQSLVALMNGLQKCLLRSGTINPKNWNRIRSWDGSRMYVDRDFPRTEVVITPFD